MSDVVLHLGDCLEFMRTLPDGAVDAVVTDIPFNEVNRDSGGFRLFDKGVADSAEFDLDSTIRQMVRVARGSLYVFCGQEQFSYIKKILIERGLSTRTIVWEKTNPSPMNGQSIWLSGIELCVYGRKPKATFNGHCKNTVLRYPTGNGLTDHPTEKPLRIINEFILTSTNFGDTVLDPFMGSGTTGVGCVQTGRKFIGCDNYPAYFAIAQRRIAEAQMQPPLFPHEPAAQAAQLTMEV